MDRLLTRRRLATLAAAGAAATPAHAAPAPVRVGHPVWLGTYGGAGCTGVPEVAAFEAWLGRRMDVVLDFLETQTWKGMINEAGWIGGCWRGARHDRVVVSVPMLVSEGSPSLQAGARGDFDAHFRALGEKLVGAGLGDSVLRIGWEFNGDWYAWSARRDPAAYAAYWRRIALAVRGVPGAQFGCDWTATVVDGPREAAYPGDDVVDLVGLDIYNQSWPMIPIAALRWEYLLHHPAGLLWHRDFSRAHGKPRSFPEWGTGTRPDGHGGGDDPLFVENMLEWIGRDGDVDYACYWNYRAGDYDAKVTDGRLPLAASALRRGLRR